MTGKFWNMYKGSASYDSFDGSDSDVMGKITDDTDLMMGETDNDDDEEARLHAWRQALKDVEELEPDPSSNSEAKVEIEDRTTIVAFEVHVNYIGLTYYVVRSGHSWARH